MVSFFLFLGLVGVFIFITSFVDGSGVVVALTGLILIVPLVLGFTVFRSEKVEAVYEEYEIFALQDNLAIKGEGGLLYHYIDSNLDYHVRRNYKGGKKTVELDGACVYLVETDSHPKVQVIRGKYLTNQWLWGEWSDNIIDIVVHVPSGTMVDDFNTDME